MRLIDADELLRTFTVNSDGRRIPEKDCDNFDLTISLKEIKQIIKERTTAYDVDKVVEDLKKCYGIVSSCSLDYAKGLRDAYERAIEIVKGGGIYG